MTLHATQWSGNPRLQRAVLNSTAMHQKDPDKAAVALLQQALTSTGIGSLAPDGAFGPKTATAVRTVESRFNLNGDQGAAGTQTLGVLDILLQGGRVGADLARADVPLARGKVQAAIRALTVFKGNMASGATQSKITVDALLAHFRLSTVLHTIGVARLVTGSDIDTILARYTQILALYGAAATRFRTGVPLNGLFFAAECPLGGPITFGPAFTDVDSHFGNKIGPNSRAAVLIHEAVHAFDGVSGDADKHISEFDPAYDRQPADLSLHNPSSFAGFAAHIQNNGDPKPRFGLGAASRAL